LQPTTIVQVTGVGHVLGSV